MSKEPSFGNQCKDNSSCKKMGSGSTMGTPSSRMTPTAGLRSEPGFPNAGGGSIGQGNKPTTGGYRGTKMGSDNC